MSNLIIRQSTLTDIGNAIREKKGTSAPIPVTALATEIRALETDGLPEDIVFTGYLFRLYYKENSSYSSSSYPDRETFLLSPNLQFLKLRDVTNLQEGFSGNKNIEDLSPVVISMTDGANNTLQGVFNGCTNLKRLPQISGAVGDISLIFANCQYLTTEEYEKFFKYLYPNTTLPQEDLNGVHAYNKRVRNLEVPLNFYDALVYKTPMFINNGRDMYREAFRSCYVLDAINNLPVVQDLPYTSGAFRLCFHHCCRLKDIKFNLNNGAPYVVPWRGVTIDLTEYIGFKGYESDVESIMEELQLPKVSDDASYQAFKNSPDWWAYNYKYSRYNHDSAVNTINTLPDASAYIAETGSAVNTIKFDGDDGELTDGGAINTLTEQEIAVAAAKGWTVTLV